MKKFATFWVWLSIVLPGVFGLLGLSNAKMMIENVTPVGLAHQTGIRQIVYALALLVAKLRLGLQAVAVLVAGRGLTDLGDGIDGMLVVGFQPPLLFPIITSFLSFWVASMLWKEGSKPSAPAS